MFCGYSLSHTVHLIASKANAIFAEMLTAWKNRSKKYAIKIFNYEEKEILLLTNEENDSYSNQKLYHICKKKFFDVDDNNDNGESGNEERFDLGKLHGNSARLREFYGDAAEPDIDNDFYDYDDSNDEKCDSRRFHDNAAAEPRIGDDDDDDDDDDNDQFTGKSFHDVSKSYERVHDHCHYTSNYSVCTASNM